MIACPWKSLTFRHISFRIMERPEACYGHRIPDTICIDLSSDDDTDDPDHGDDEPEDMTDGVPTRIIAAFQSERPPARLSTPASASTKVKTTMTAVPPPPSSSSSLESSSNSSTPSTRTESNDMLRDIQDKLLDESLRRRRRKQLRSVFMWGSSSVLSMKQSLITSTPKGDAKISDRIQQRRMRLFRQECRLNDSLSAATTSLSSSSRSARSLLMDSNHDRTINEEVADVNMNVNMDMNTEEPLFCSDEKYTKRVSTMSTMTNESTSTISPQPLPSTTTETTTSLYDTGRSYEEMEAFGFPSKSFRFSFLAVLKQKLAEIERGLCVTPKTPPKHVLDPSHTVAVSPTSVLL